YLVQYDELPARKDDAVRRAYWLLHNARKVEAGKEPLFVNETSPPTGQPLLVLPWDTPSETNSYVRLKTETRTIEVIDHNQSMGVHSLPVYQTTGDLALKVALTPFAFTADVCIVGIIAGTIMAWHSGFSGTLETRPCLRFKNLV